MSKDESTLISRTAIWDAEDAALARLKKSSELVDQITVVLMEPHVEPDVPFGQNDNFGLYYNFARPKAAVIMERFNVTAKDSSSPLP